MRGKQLRVDELTMKHSKLDARTAIAGAAGATIGDYWAWAYSDVLANTDRGCFAEFLVAAALGITSEPRNTWAPCDLSYRGRGIEVKSSGYCQSWHQRGPSKIVFGIAPKRPWDAETGTLGTERVRSAACYVFALFTERDQSLARARILDVSAWKFYVLGTSALTADVGEQKTLTLDRLKRVTTPVAYSDLRTAIEKALQSVSAG